MNIKEVIIEILNIV